MTSDTQWWSDAEEHGAICQREQRNTAVYLGETGQIVIRQEAGLYEDEDHIIFIAPENAERVAKAILAAAAEARGEQPADSQEPERPPTANAIRQKRYRQRRNAQTVTHRNAETVTRNGESVTPGNEANESLVTPGFDLFDEEHRLSRAD